MAGRDLGEEIAEVGRHREVAALEELLAVEAGPAAVDAAAAHAAAEDEHRRRVAVVGAAVTVLGDGAPELRHCEHHDVRHIVAEFMGEYRDRCEEVREAKGELAALGALAYMRDTALTLGEGDIET